MPQATPYSAKKIAQVRSWVKDCSTWLEARAIIVDKLGIHPDNATKMQRRHRFWVEGDAPKAVTLAPRGIRRLFIDIETSPNVVLSWRVGRKIDLNYDSILKERAVICAAWSWGGETKVRTAHWDSKQDDKAVLAPLLEAVNEADEIVYHNGDRFDLPWVRTRCLFHHLRTLPDYKTVDTLKWARQKFYFNSNRLDYLAKFLGLGGKLHTGAALWKAVVLDNCPKALAKMVRYNVHDVVLLKKVWARLAEVMPHKTHVGVLGGGEKWSCPYDGSTRVKLSKTRCTARGGAQYQMQCLDCGRYYTISPAAYKAYTETKG